MLLCLHAHDVLKAIVDTRHMALRCAQRREWRFAYARAAARDDGDVEMMLRKHYASLPRCAMIFRHKTLILFFISMMSLYFHDDLLTPCHAIVV